MNLLLRVLVFAWAMPALAAGATVKIENGSRWEIHHVFLSPSDEQSWGEDQLEDEILAPGEVLTLTGIDCDLYDVKIVDQEGDACILEEVDLCEGQSVWKITDEDLLECEGY
jgi:hypothetical protein